MATLSVIRRWALREQMSIREIARRTGLSRNTVKKYLRAGEEMPRYAKRASSSKLDPYADKLATWLAIEATKSRKQRRNLRQIHTASIQKGEHQALIHTVKPSGSQSGWVSIRWKSRVRDRWNSTIPMSSRAIVGAQRVDKSSRSRTTTFIPAAVRIRGNSPALTLAARNASVKPAGSAGSPTKQNTVPCRPNRSRPSAEPSRLLGVLRLTKRNVRTSWRRRQQRENAKNVSRP